MEGWSSIDATHLRAAPWSAHRADAKPAGDDIIEIAAKAKWEVRALITISIESQEVLSFLVRATPIERDVREVLHIANLVTLYVPRSPMLSYLEG